MQPAHAQKPLPAGQPCGRSGPMSCDSLAAGIRNSQVTLFPNRGFALVKWCSCVDLASWVEGQ